MCQLRIGSMPGRVSGIGQEITLNRRGSYITLRIAGDLTADWLVVAGSYAARVGKPINRDTPSQR